MQILPKMTLSGVALATALSIVSCSKDDSIQPVETKLNGLKYTLVDSGSLVQEGESLRGTGSVALAQPLEDTASDNNFALAFTLEEGGSLTLIANATPLLENGIEIRFLREGTVLKGSLTSTDDETLDISEQLQTIPANGEIKLLIDVLNSKEPAQVLIWSDQDETTRENALIATETSTSLGNGSDRYWGLTLTNAQISRAAVAGRISALPEQQEESDTETAENSAQENDTENN